MKQKQVLRDLMTLAMNSERCSAHVRTEVRRWVELDERFNEWFLEEIKPQRSEEWIMNMLGEDGPAYKAIWKAVIRYRSHPKAKNEAPLLSAINESIRIRASYMGDWTPKAS